MADTTVKFLKAELARARAEIELQQAKLGALEDVAVLRGRQLRDILTAAQAEPTLSPLVNTIDPSGMIRSGACA